MTIFLTAGGRICCGQCSAKSKRTGLQCRAPAIKGQTKCKSHGGRSSGPKTQTGKKRCADAKTVHGRETRKARAQRALAMKRLRNLEDMGHHLGIMSGPRITGRKPT